MNTLESIAFAETMARYGWDVVQEFPEGSGRFVVGVRSGVNDWVTLKSCSRESEAGLWLSPAGPSVLKALEAARKKYWKMKRLVPSAAHEWETSQGLAIL
jgi:hypothetical protein